MSFERYVCWPANRVHVVLNPDAEHVADEVFLAVHQERLLWIVDPVDSERGWSQSASDFLAEFLSPTRSQVQTVVIGDSGSGKSHLIHWLALKIPGSEAREVVLVPRTGTSLRGVLEKVIAILPTERQGHYRERLEQSAYESASHQQRKEQLLSAIAVAITLDRVAPESPDPDGEEWLLKGLPHLFNDPSLRQRYVTRSSIIDELAAHIAERPTEYRRAGKQWAFGVNDLPLTGVETADLDKLTRDFLTSLMGLPDYVDLAVKIINRNLDVAIRHLLNFSGEHLVELMRNVRRYLRREGKELVLLIEDLARLQGIDLALLEALIEAPSSEVDTVCNLRWAMAVTSGYFFERLSRTIRTRLDFVVDMDAIVGDSTTSKTEPGVPFGEKDLVAFAASYLNAVRLAEADLQSWYRKLQREGQATLPNLCPSCEHRSACHAAFGAVADVGLYPFTPRAIRNLARYKGAFDAKFNPRRLIKDVLAEVLDGHRDELTGGEFPSWALRQKMIPRGQGLAPADVQRLEHTNREHYRRQETVLEIWGELTRPIQLPDELYAAFSLPPPRVAGPVPKPEPEPIPPTPQPVPSILDQRVQAIRAWANGGPLRERVAAELREPLHRAILAFIDWDSIGLERTQFASTTTGFRPRDIEFRHQQTTGRVSNVHLLIPFVENRDDYRQAALALEGLVSFQHYQNWNFPNGDVLFVALAECLESWAANVVEQFRGLPDPKRVWDPVASAVELLAVGAALAGLIESQPPAVINFINAIFDPWPGEAPAMSPKWRQLYLEIRERQSDLVAIIQQWAAGTKGGQAGSFVDAARVAPSLRQLIPAWTLRAVPPKEANDRADLHGTLAKLHRRCQDLLPRAVAEEGEKLTSWNQQLSQYLGDGNAAEAGALLSEVRAEATRAGLNVNAELIHRLDSALFGLDGLDLATPRALAAEIAGAADLQPFLPRLARESIARAARNSTAFVDAASRYLQAVDRQVERERAQLAADGGIDIAALHRRIDESFTQLGDVLGRFGGTDADGQR